MDRPNPKIELKDVMGAIDQLCYSGKIGQAVDLYLEVSPLFSKQKVLLSGLVRHLIKAEDFKRALEILEKNAPDGSDIGLLTLLGFCLEGVGRIDEAETVCKQAKALAGQDSQVAHLQALLQYDRGDKQSAADKFLRAIEMDPSYGQAYADLGLLKIETGEVEKGFELLKEGFVRSPDNATVAERFHQVVSDTNAFAMAEPLFQAGLNRYPYHKKLNYLNIDILIRQGKHALAMAAIEKAIYLFGVSDGILEPALVVRDLLGPMEITDRTAGDNTVSLCMIVKNEAHQLARCLYRVKPIVDEIIIVDTGSSDHTVDITTCYGAKIYHHQWDNDFSDARNVSLRHAHGKWVLIIDADEVISPSDHESLLNMVKQSNGDRQAFRFETRNYTDDVGFEGWHPNDGRYPDEQAGAGWCPSRKVRLFPNNAAIRFVNPIHELVEPSLRAMGFVIEDCQIPIHHYGKLEKRQDSIKKKDYFQLGLKKSQQKKDDLYALFELAIQAGEVGEFQKAIDLWNEILKAAPNLSQAYFNLSYAYIQLEQYQAGAKASQKAMELDPALKEASLNHVLCQIRLGNPTRAAHLLDGFLQIFPKHPMAMGLMAMTFCLVNQPEKALAQLHKIEQMAFDCPGYILEHVQKMISAGRKADAAVILKAVANSSYWTPALGVVSERLTDYRVLAPTLTIAWFDLQCHDEHRKPFLTPMEEIEKADWRHIRVLDDVQRADFILFPFALDRLYQQLGHDQTIAYLRSLPGFEQGEDRYVFFFKDDIGRALGLRSVIYRVNHNLNSMDLNSITLPYFFEDVFCESIGLKMRYQVNFVGALVTHVFRAYMLLPFIEKQQLPAYDTLLKSIDRLLLVRRDKNQYAAVLKKTLTYIRQLFPMETQKFGIKYYFNIIADQYPRLPTAGRQKMKNELLTIMNQSMATLCPRGVGSQSIRFFETLSMGRIPFVISDRYIFPLDHQIDYDQFIFRIKESRIKHLPDEIAGFFERTPVDRIRQMGLLARNTWLSFFAPSKFDRFIELTLFEVLRKKRCLNKSRLQS